MAKRPRNAGLNHDIANPAAAQSCDALFDNLAQRMGPLDRMKTGRWCSFSKRNGSEFAHISHRITLPRIEVWFTGKPHVIEQYTRLQIRERKATNSGWGKFNLRFFLDDTSQVQEAANVVAARFQAAEEALRARTDFNLFPDEIIDRRPMSEGALRTTIVNSYERQKELRDRCIDHYGANCHICGFNFGDVYGPVVEGFIHVHHLRSLGDVGQEHLVDPVADLRPLCPNCHAVVHSRASQAYGIEEVRQFLDGRTAEKQSNIEFRTTKQLPESARTP